MSPLLKRKKNLRKINEVIRVCIVPRRMCAYLNKEAKEMNCVTQIHADLAVEVVDGTL
jgi:hypothetical protein